MGPFRASEIKPHRPELGNNKLSENFLRDRVKSDRDLRLAENLDNFVEVWRHSGARQSNAEDFGEIADIAFIKLWVGFIGFLVGGEAMGGANFL